MIITRQWAMPSSKTFSIKPIENLLSRYIVGDMIVVDPFARDNVWATHTNDLNPATTATHHMDAEAFMQMMASEVVCDVVLLDPPYSPRQIMECYQSVGRKVQQYDTQMSPMLNHVRDFADQMLRAGGLVISFGWNSAGMGITRGYDPVEFMMVCHGGPHNDTIITVERKRQNDLIGLFSDFAGTQR